MSGISVEAFYALGSDEQVEAQRELVHSALGAWDLGRVEDVALLAERENAVFSVATARGRYVARVHRAGYHTDDQLRSQVAWMRALADAEVVDTAPVVDTTEGEVFVVAEHDRVPEARQVSVLAFAPGDQLSERLERADTEEAVGMYREVGALVAAVHDHAEGWVRPDGFRAFRWDVDGLLGDQPIWGRFWDLDQLDREGRAVMTEFRRRAVEQLDAFGPASDRFGLIHNDLLAENLLVADRRLILLDFDDCGDGWLLTDLCPALVSVSTRDDYLELRNSLIDGYRSVRALDDGQVALLPLFFALRMATYAGWLDTRRHTRFARELGEVIVAAAVDVIRSHLDETLDV